MCLYAAYYHCSCQHIDVQPVSMCAAVKAELLRVSEQSESISSAVPFSPTPFCIPRLPESGVQSNVVQYHIVQPDEMGPVVSGRKKRAELFVRGAQGPLHSGDVPYVPNGGVFEQIEPQGHTRFHGQTVVPHEQFYHHHQTGSWEYGQQQSQDQIQNQDQAYFDPRPNHQPILGLCYYCTEQIESIQRIHQTQPNYGLTDDDFLSPEILPFIVDVFKKAYELVDKWIECLNALNPLAGRFASLDYPGFPFHLALASTYPSPPQISMEPMIEELMKEIMMRKMNAMIIQNNEQVRAVENRFAIEGSAYYENNPNRFVSHAPAEDPFITNNESLGDVPEILVFRPALYIPLPEEQEQERFIKPKIRVSRAVRNSIYAREKGISSPTPLPKNMDKSSMPDMVMSVSTEIDEGSDTDRFTTTDHDSNADDIVSSDIDCDGDTDYDFDANADTNADADGDADGDTVVYPDSIADDRSSPLDMMSDTPELTLDTTPSCATVTSVQTPRTAPRSKKRVRIQNPLPERWRSALRPRHSLRSESLSGLYLD